jgi:ribosomal protein S27AE
MSDQTSYCPQCHNEVLFARSGDSAMCPLCGFEYKLNLAAPPKLPSPALGIAKVLLRIVLIIVGVIVIGIAILFAGCALMLSGGHF